MTDDSSPVVLGLGPAGPATGPRSQLRDAVHCDYLPASFWYCSTRLAGIRPRSLTSSPLALAQPRMAWFAPGPYALAPPPGWAGRLCRRGPTWLPTLVPRRDLTRSIVLRRRCQSF